MTDDPTAPFTLAQAADEFGLSAGEVRVYVEEGLVAGTGDPPAFTRAQMRRLWSAVTLHRDLGINLAGVQAVLKLREQFEGVRRDLALLMEIMERELGPDVWDRLWPKDRPHPGTHIAVETVSGSPRPADREIGPSGDAARARPDADGPDAEAAAEGRGGEDRP